MNESKRMKYCRAGFILTTFLLLGDPLQARAFQQSAGGAGMAGAPAMREVSGTVVETINSGGYTYALVDKSGVKTWVAVPQSEIVVGSDIACQPGVAMTNFSSTTLNRSFESIVFSSGLASADGGAARGPASAAAASATAAIVVGKAEGADAQTIGEIYEKKNSLANKPVVVQGKVVKVSRGIMGKNWLHLQDGTGSPAAGSHDLVVTTDSVPSVNDVVTIKGNLSLDRDFGAGYRYGVIVEGAEVTGSK